ncbi:MAG: hypothetical protein ACI4K7_04585 [Oscillospiraceae bacterium]
MNSDASAQDSPQKMSSDDALKFVYNSFEKSGALLKGTTFEKFLANAERGILNTSMNTTPKIADDIVKGNAVNNYTVNNTANVTNNITVNGHGKSDEELANEIAEACDLRCENKIGQAFSTYERTFNNTLTKIMYSNE